MINTVNTKNVLENIFYHRAILMIVKVKKIERYSTISTINIKHTRLILYL